MALTQTEKNKNWQRKNPEYTRYLQGRSNARSFIKKRAKADDLDELQVLIDIRRQELKKTQN